MRVFQFAAHLALRVVHHVERGLFRVLDVNDGDAFMTIGDVSVGARDIKFVGIGEADDGAGVPAMVVRIDGTTDRPDGSTFHITWSLDKGRGRRAVQSNDVIRERGWKPLPQPVPVTVRPARFP